MRVTCRWRIGYLAGPPGFAEIASTVGGQMALSVSAVSQIAATAVFSGPQDVVHECERNNFLFYSAADSADSADTAAAAAAAAAARELLLLLLLLVSTDHS